MSLASVERDGSSFAAHRPLAAISTTKPKLANFSMATGSTPATAVTLRLVTSSSPAVSRPSSYVRGRHLYPQEIEEAVAGVPGVHKGGVAVFGVPDRASGTERVMVLVETRETDQVARTILQACIAQSPGGSGSSTATSRRDVPHSAGIRQPAHEDVRRTSVHDRPSRGCWSRFAWLIATPLDPSAAWAYTGSPQLRLHPRMRPSNATSTKPTMSCEFICATSFGAYNFARRLKTLRGLTPYEFICKAWTSQPQRFTISPLQKMPGLNI